MVIVPQKQVKSRAYGKHRDGATPVAGTMKPRSQEETFNKSILMTREDAVRYARILRACAWVVSSDAVSAEVRRDHHLRASETERRFYVRWQEDEALKPSRPEAVVTDLGIRRAFAQWHEMITAPMDDGRYLVVHEFPEELGGGCHIYETDHHACTCPQAMFRGTCKHQFRIRAEYPLTPDAPIEPRKTFSSRAEFLRNANLDY